RQRAAMRRSRRKRIAARPAGHPSPVVEARAPFPLLAPAFASGPPRRGRTARPRRRRRSANGGAAAAGHRDAERHAPRLRQRRTGRTPPQSTCVPSSPCRFRSIVAASLAPKPHLLIGFGILPLEPGRDAADVLSVTSASYR